MRSVPKASPTRERSGTSAGTARGGSATQDGASTGKPISVAAAVIRRS